MYNKNQSIQIGEPLGMEVRPRSHILVISNKGDITTDLVIKRLRDLHLPFVRFNTEDFPKEVEITIDVSNDNSGVEISTPKQRLSDKDIKVVWYRRPKLPDFQDCDLSTDDCLFAIRETDEFFQNLWYFLNEVHWVNSPHALAKAEMKALQLKVASMVGFTIPHTNFSNSGRAFDLLRKTHDNHIVVKPISHGSYGKADDSAIFATDLSDAPIDPENFSIETCPLIIQEKVFKKSDVRLTVFGEELFAYEIQPNDKNQPVLDWRRYSPDQLKHSRVNPPFHVVESIRHFMKYFELKFGAFDFALDTNGEWIFLEINPSGQFAWLELATGDRLIDSLIRLLNGENKI